MANEYLLTNNGRPLNGENFNAWKIRMIHTLNTFGLRDYIMADSTKAVIPPERREQVEKENSLALSILLNNIEDDVYALLDDYDSPFELMNNLETLFAKDKDVTLQQWIEKLKRLKVKNNKDLLEVTSRMITIFKKMDKSKVPLTESEKINYMLDCMPKELKIIFISGNIKTAQGLFEDIKLKYKLLYHVGNKNDNQRNYNEEEDKMDIDIINNILNTNNNKPRIKNKKFCHICNMKNHNTDECYFNAKNKTNFKHNTKKYRGNNINNNNNFNNHKNYNKNNNNNNKFKNQKNFYINENNQDTINYDSDNNEKYLFNINKGNNNKENFTTWVYDTGASEHITNNFSILTNFVKLPVTMKCANNSSIDFQGYGTYYGKLNDHNIKLNKVYFSKDVSQNLISGVKLAQSNITCELKNYLNKPELNLSYNNNIIFKTYINKHKNFTIKTKNKYNLLNQNLYNINDEKSNKIWHNRLGHYYNENMENYLKEHKINNNECIECKISKLNRKPHNGITPKATKINEIIYSDIMGPIQESINQYKYIITFIDDFSRKAWIYTLKSKADATNTIINFIKLINNQYPDNKIKIFKSDNAKEYNNKKIINFCKKHGIKKEFSPPYNPQNNGIAERFNRTISTCTKTILYWAGLSTNFWEYAVKHATYIYNLIPHKGINNNIPNEIYYNKKVNLKYLKTFGCLAYYKNFKQHLPKFDINSKKGVYLGFDNNTHSYMIMDYYDHSIHFTREAIFIEDTPANLRISSGNNTTKYLKISNNTNSNHINIDYTNLNISKIPDDYSNFTETDTKEILSDNENQDESNNYKINNINEISDCKNNTESYSDQDSNIIYDNNTDTSEIIPYKHVDIIKNKDNLYIPKIFVINTEVPMCYNHIYNREDKQLWFKAIKNELDNLYKNNVMTFIKSIPDNHNVIATKWIFAIKRNKNNEIIKYKARLVARGDKQIHGIDYSIIYSPTLDIVCIRLILFLASKFKWNVFQLDIQAAYLNAPIYEDVYVKIPQGDINFGKGFWKLNKSLYGLKQSGRNWNFTISNFLIKIGFKQCKCEPCLFYYYNNKQEVTCLIGLYVDDMIITGFNHELLYFIQKIKNKFSISNCQFINYILGISIDKDDNFNYTINQKAYITNILNRYKISNIKKCSTPCTGENTISKNIQPFHPTTYKSAIGSLIHLAKCTRPDISFAVNYAARFCESPTVSDWNKILNIFKYLNNTINYKISFNGKGNLHAFSDADFGGDKIDRKSTSGMIISFGNNPIFWTSNKQKTVALSTAEAEFISAAKCSKKILWIQNLLKEIFNKNFKTTLFLDNLSAKKVIENGQFNNNLKHIDIKLHFIFDLIKNNKINLEYIESEKMLADVLTKNVNGTKISKFANIIFSR